MITHKINIIPFDKIYKSEIDTLMISISEEFTEPISISKPNINASIIQLPDLYLLAILESEVVGTISLTKLKGEYSVLKKMFLHKNFRGKGIAKLLLNAVINWAIENKLKAIYLGTMTQFVAAQKFYEKNGFKKIPYKDLPEDFPLNPLDAIFYQIKLV